MKIDENGLMGPHMGPDYGTLLKRPEWTNRRRELLGDAHRCELSEKTDNGIELHHKYYVRNRLPWEYPDNSFMILCSSCHTAYHKLREVPEYQELDFDFCAKYDFDNLSFVYDYDSGNYGLKFFRLNGRVTFIKFNDVNSICFCDTRKTIGQLIHGLDIQVIHFPLSPGRVYKKYFSKDSIEFYIDGWSTEEFLELQVSKK